MYQNSALNQNNSDFSVFHTAESVCLNTSQAAGVTLLLLRLNTVDWWSMWPSRWMENVRLELEFDAFQSLICCWSAPAVNRPAASPQKHSVRILLTWRTIANLTLQVREHSCVVIIYCEAYTTDIQYNTFLFLRMFLRKI